MTETILYWLRQDLRIADNPALTWAAARGAVLPVYILDTSRDDHWNLGGASKWWLHHALLDLAMEFEKLGTKLILRRGDPQKIMHELARETDAKTVLWSRCYEPYTIRRDTAIKSSLEAEGLEVVTHNTSLLCEPWNVKTGTGGPYKVYTPFSKAMFAKDFGTPLPAPKKLQSPRAVTSDKLEDWKLLPTHPNWAAPMAQEWKPTAAAGKKMAAEFIQSNIVAYKDGRDRPDTNKTSRLSPYLHFGQISPRGLWHATAVARAAHGHASSGIETYQRELLWREFSYHLLYHFPQLPEKPLNPQFEQFEWQKNDAGLRAWQRGQTGYPIVDAGMRQLWQTGWMHNRVRMITASFFVKDMLIPWQRGAAWFWDTLVDADLASNSASWQWVAGCGADAAPFFRIFNPILQGKKFDPHGDYVRRYVPELAGLSAADIHEPWKADQATLSKAGIALGKHYPMPILDHYEARNHALAMLKATKKNNSSPS